MARTREQIKAEIDYVTRTMRADENDLADYKKSLNHLKDLLTNLTSCLNYLDQANDYIKRSFVINGKKGDNDKTNSIKIEVKSIIKDINVIVYPGINQKVSSLNKEILQKKEKISKLQREYANYGEIK